MNSEGDQVCGTCGGPATSLFLGFYFCDPHISQFFRDFMGKHVHKITDRETKREILERYYDKR
jgi:hypothetical protein